ncbi:sodium potassium calcium exchanger [Blastocystis sp. subtype 4]|uniref:sodium potassium calcium exchanger n=1 Tax=Blastocystis sp. subtype 4 TaxID=944170 RepID=UPI00071153CF|nr:sodium potassium calcium exchanger [Blastocystis sp. subtype 4]KNB44140.1 sodium potassium calcium exchanger [Blastocystis sp. subtype 4]|eukprot:XP_014527588.1 sodium potassium calcium exchanger [Blastocystis sp. subtype 4]
MDAELYLSKLSEESSWCKSGFEGLCLDAIDGYWWGILIEICDEFLVPSLEIMCVKLNLKEDVAGASFMAFGASAPEIVISIITTIQGGDNVDIGVGSIIGSGMIGLMLIPGICGVSSKSDLILKRRPLTRDVIFYVFCLGGLVFFLMDEYIYPLEGIYLLLIYIAYVLLLVFAPMVRRSYRIKNHLIDPNITTSFIKQEGLDSDEERTYEPIASLQPIDQEVAFEESFNPVDMNTPLTVGAKVKSSISKFFGCLGNIYKNYLERVVSWFFNHVIVKSTHNTPSENLYPLTFLLSIFWLAITTYVMISSFHSPAIGTLVGMVLISLGAAIADIMQCYIVSRKGYGSMAISNSIGSQILNICVGLGLPWLIKGMLSGEGVWIPGSSTVSKAGILLAVGSLLLIGITLVPALIFKEDKARLGQ